MLITWLGHSCFTLSESGYSVLMDPYEPGCVPGLRLPAVEADAVLISHDHRDHNYRNAASIRAGGGLPFKVTAIHTWHDGENGKKRGNNIIHVVDSESGIRAVHLGDLGCAVTDAQAEKIGRPDVLMIPVGGFFTIDAKEAAAIVKRLSPRVVLPMHYRGDDFGFDKLGGADGFAELFDKGCVRYYGVNSIEVGSDTPKQIAVLKYIKP